MTNEEKFADRAVYKVTINAPIATVWSELIKTVSPRPFFWNSSWDARAMAPGNAYRMVSNNGKTVAVVGRILEMDPPRRLVTSFRLTALNDPPSRVIYTLEDKGSATEFCLVTENVAAGSKSERSMADGSKFIVRNFKAYVETGNITFAARVLLALYALMAPMTPKSMSADKWPLGKID